MAKIAQPLLSAVLRLVNRWAARITRVGERHQVECLIYNPLTFLYFFGRSLADAPGVIKTLRTVAPHARSYVDVGAGSGGFAAAARRAGIETEACEHSRVGRAFARLIGVEATPLDLSRMPPASLSATFDLAYCFEVAEHLPPELGDRLVEFIAQLSPLVVFTAAQPDQGGTGHVNEQRPGYWIERFEAAHLVYDVQLTRQAADEFRAASVAPWFANNVLIFSAGPEWPASHS